MVVFDSSVLLLALRPSAPPLDPTTGKILVGAKARVDFLIKTLDNSKTRILIPTPVLAEILIGTGPASIPDLVNELKQMAVFRMASFDQVAAIELALLNDSPKHVKRNKLSPVETKAKVKFDRQIIAITKANGVKTIYSDDDGVASVAGHNGIKAIRSYELPLPPEDMQKDMFVGPGAENIE